VAEPTDTYNTDILLDPRWLRDRDVLARLVPHFRDKMIAEQQITLALRDGMDCLNCYFDSKTWICRRVPSLCWQEPTEWTEVVRHHYWRPPPTAAILPGLEWHVRHGFGRLGSMLFFWLPYLERRWPIVFSPPAAETATKQRMKLRAQRRTDGGYQARRVRAKLRALENKGLLDQYDETELRTKIKRSFPSNPKGGLGNPSRQVIDTTIRKYLSEREKRSASLSD
jgi:hypothetical protein